MRFPAFPYFLVLAALVLAACDTGFTGDALENQPPDTQLSVRDTSLVDNLGEDDRLSSTVAVAWSGTDVDGFVDAFEVRFFSPSEAPSGPEDGWTMTPRNDSLVLLPIPRGERIADVVFEVRAIDNMGQKDPTPARTVFPIQNAPPTLRLSTFEAPPDTTFSVVSFAWTANDPEGPDNLDRIEVSLNDSLTFTSLPPDVEFITLVGDVDAGNPNQTETTAEVYTGRGFQRTGVELPGLLLNADNTLYVRAVDLTDTTSTLERYTWYVKRPGGEVLYVNDYRKSTWPIIQAFHLNLLRNYLPPGTSVDIWNISEPFGTGSSGITPRSNALPSTASPTLREQLALYQYIYWVSTNSTNNTTSNNLPFASSVMDLFFEQGGKLMVHTPISLPGNPEDNLGNPAILLLPLSDLIMFPDTLRPQLRLPVGSAIPPVGSLPDVATPLPPLEIAQFQIGVLPFIAEGNNIIPLYEADFVAIPTSGQGTREWNGPATVAAISADQRIGLFALPLINEQSGEPIVVGADDDPDAPIRAVQAMLESLGFPKR
jgi:hypothetical protein